ncbi:MAG: 7TM diverse intracellular signaling domain-containing protein [Maribacter sp.]
MNSEDFNYLLTCMFTAVFGVFGIYHLASFLILRHKILLYYAILILALTLHWSWFLLALGPLDAAIADKASVITAMAATYGLLMFTKNYLNIKKKSHPNLSRCYIILKRLVVWIPVLFILNILTVKNEWLNNSLVMLAAIAAMVSVFMNIFSGVSLYKEEKFNKFYLYSYTPLLLSAIIYIGTWFLQKQYIVDTLFVLVTTSSLITLQLILFSILVGYKFKSIEDENIRMQIETNKLLTIEVDKQTKNLQIAKRALEIQNQELETVNVLKNKLF